MTINKSPKIPVIQPPIFIVTGMHRSGTSLTASFLNAVGINLGKTFIQPDAFNVKGYFEDVEFVEFQRSLLRDCCPTGEVGWPDWGWTESEYLDKTKFQDYLPAAQNLINARRQNALPWGWKDPRTSLMLDFWDRLLPEAYYLFVYRFPWDVADSILRLNSPIFSQHPDYALRIWDFYNRQIIEFCDRHRDRCILFHLNSFIQNPNRLIELLKTKFNLQLEGLKEIELQKIYEKQLLQSLDWSHPLVQLLQKTAPHYFYLLENLDFLADIPSDFSLKATEYNPESLLLFLHHQNRLDKAPVGAVPSRPLQTSKLSAIATEISKNEIALSVVIPCYNQGEFLLDAISSVEECLENVWEIIIVNDGSTELLTQQILNYLKNQGYWAIDQSNQGLAAARNKGISVARGRYILPLDADNKIRPEYITKAISILDNFPEVGVVYSNAEFFGEQTGLWEVADFDLDRLLCGNYIDACAAFRKTVWQECGGYDSNIPEKLGYEDWDFWLSAVEKGWQFYRIAEVLFDYRVRVGSMVSACTIPENARKLMRYICAKHHNLYTTDGRFAKAIAQKEYDWLLALQNQKNPGL